VRARAGLDLCRGEDSREGVLRPSNLLEFWSRDESRIVSARLLEGPGHLHSFGYRFDRLASRTGSERARLGRNRSSDLRFGRCGGQPQASSWRFVSRDRRRRRVLHLICDGGLERFELTRGHRVETDSNSCIDRLREVRLLAGGAARGVGLPKLKGRWYDAFQTRRNETLNTHVRGMSVAFGCSVAL